MTLWKSKD